MRRMFNTLSPQLFHKQHFPPITMVAGRIKILSGFRNLVRSYFFKNVMRVGCRAAMDWVTSTCGPVVTEGRTMTATAMVMLPPCGPSL